MCRSASVLPKDFYTCGDIRKGGFSPAEIFEDIERTFEMPRLLPEVRKPRVRVRRGGGRPERRDVLVELSRREIVVSFGFEGLGKQCTRFAEIVVRRLDALQEPDRSRTLIMLKGELRGGKDLAVALESRQPSIDRTELAITLDRSAIV